MPLSRLVQVETNRRIHLDLFLILLQSSQGMALGVTEDYTENTCSDSSSSSHDSDASTCTSSDIQAPPFSPLTSDITSSEDE